MTAKVQAPSPSTRITAISPSSRSAPKDCTTDTVKHDTVITTVDKKKELYTKRQFVGAKNAQSSRASGYPSTKYFLKIVDGNLLKNCLIHNNIRHHRRRRNSRTQHGEPERKNNEESSESSKG